MHLTPKKILTSKPVLALEFLLILFFAFNVGQEILKRKAIEAEIKSLENEIGKLETDKDDLSKLLAYVETDSFIKNEARDKLNLVESGENVVVIPDIDAAAQDASSSPDVSVSLAAGIPDSNLKRWWEYFFDYDKLWIE